MVATFKQNLATSVLIFESGETVFFKFGAKRKVKFIINEFDLVLDKSTNGVVGA